MKKRHLRLATVNGNKIPENSELTTTELLFFDELHKCFEIDLSDLIDDSEELLFDVSPSKSTVLPFRRAESPDTKNGK
jgi:hypothetical protein